MESKKRQVKISYNNDSDRINVKPLPNFHILSQPCNI